MQFLVGLLQKFVNQTQLVQQFQRGRVNGVAPEIPQEVSVFFQYGNRYPGAGEQKAQHHSSWTTTHNTAGCLIRLSLLGGVCCHALIPITYAL
jgi:hypothetical protein